MSDPFGNDTAAGVMVILIAYAVFVGAILLFQYVLTGVTLGMFFRKVGVWRGIAWVPIYNHWTWLRVGGQPGALALLYLTPAAVVARVFECIGMYRTDIAFRKDTSWVVLGILLPWLWCNPAGPAARAVRAAAHRGCGIPAAAGRHRFGGLRCRRAPAALNVIIDHAR